MTDIKPVSAVPVAVTVSLDGITATVILDRDPEYPGTVRVRLQLDPPMGGISTDAYIAYPRVPGYR